ncbi:MAG: S8 family serine peptidase [Planctomycetes bacterium]|nr:S8 family serine peptidase [Planctomycetota bacterium]
MRRTATFWLSGVLGIALAAATARADAAPPGAPSAHVDRRVQEALEAGADACLLVRLRETAHAGNRLERRRAIRGLQDRFLRRIEGHDLDLRYRFRCSPTVVLATRSRALLEQIATDAAVVSVDLDQPGSGALDESRGVVHADAVFDLGLRGAGKIVAVLDSGVDSDHPDLESAIIHQWRFLDQGGDTGEGAEDGNGHGTHVTGIIASAGTVAPRGVAPEAQIVAVKVLDDENRGWLVDWTAGVEHVIALHEAENGIRIDAINMSLVTDAQYTGVCDASHEAFARAARDAEELGIAVFASSGNTGNMYRMSMPACFSSVISVGSVPDTAPDGVSDFTSRNELLDLLAPGEPITSTSLGGGSEVRSGTSMAAPHASAACLLLLDTAPSIRPEEVREIFRQSGQPVYDELTNRNIPRLDILAAVLAASLAPIDGLSCRAELSTARCVAVWEPVLQVDGIRVLVRRDGESIIEQTFPQETTSFSFDLGAVDAPTLIDLCVTPERSGSPGRSACCSLQVPAYGVPFVRSDCNDDGDINVSDPIQMLIRLFLGGSGSTPCLAACDANSDGLTDITDPVYTLGMLFLGQSMPPAPFPHCGWDPTPSGLGCEASICAQ